MNYQAVRWAFAIACVQMLSGCMTGPNNESTIPHRFEPLLWQGYASRPNSITLLEAVDGPTSQWTRIGFALSSTTAVVDADGQSWYYWSTTTPRQRDGRFWPPVNGASQGRFRAFVNGDFSDIGTQALTFTASETFCVATQVAAGLGYASAASACGAQQNEVKITAPCDALVSGGCYDLPRLDQLEDYPFDRSMEFSNGLQGVANDGENWYFTSTHRSGSLTNPGEQLSRYAKVHVGTDLNNQPTYYGNPYAPAHRHFGDLDHFDGMLFVPLEKSEGTASFNAIGFIRASDLWWFPSQPIPTSSPQRSGDIFPWIARNPIDGLFYSSKFNGANTLYKYNVSLSGVSYVGSVPMSKTLNRVQGGEFSPSGRLYLSTDDSASSAVNVVELANSNLAVVVGVGNLTWDPPGEEIEGLTIWDLDADPRAPGVDGQIHVIMLQLDSGSNDNWYFKHMRANPVSEL